MSQSKTLRAPVKTPDRQFRSAVDLFGKKIEDRDGEVCGKCRDFLFDDQHWTIRYVVADTGGFLSRNEVLLSPYTFENPEFGPYTQHLPTVLTRDLIEASPPLEADAPISRQFEEELVAHFDYPLYWAGAGLWGYGPYPSAEVPDPAENRRHRERLEEITESHLRSCDELTDYRMMAGDEEIGRLTDFIVETKPWKIRYLVVRTGSWLKSREVVISPDWISSISWSERVVAADDLDRSRIAEAPSFDSHVGVNRDYEGMLYDYYGRPRYW